MRLDRLLANRGYCARSQVQAFIGARDVCFDGRPCKRVDQHVDDSLTIDGEAIDPEHLYLLMHKPVGVVCSHRDPGTLVYELLPDRWNKRSPPLTTVGRLDKETSGLLILSTDGDLVHRLTHPKKHVPKVYHALLRDPLRGTEAALFASGTMLLDDNEKPLQPAQLEAIEPTRVRLTIHEGRYHQVRKMFAATGNLVLELHRQRMGALDLPADLPAGQWRTLSDAERAMLFEI